MRLNWKLLSVNTKCEIHKHRQRSNQLTSVPTKNIVLMFFSVRFPGTGVVVCDLEASTGVAAAAAAVESLSSSTTALNTQHLTQQFMWHSIDSDVKFACFSATLSVWRLNYSSIIILGFFVYSV